MKRPWVCVLKANVSRTKRPRGCGSQHSNLTMTLQRRPCLSLAGEQVDGREECPRRGKVDHCALEGGQLVRSWYSLHIRPLLLELRRGSCRTDAGSPRLPRGAPPVHEQTRRTRVLSWLALAPRTPCTPSPLQFSWSLPPGPYAAAPSTGSEEGSCRTRQRRCAAHLLVRCPEGLSHPFISLARRGHMAAPSAGRAQSETCQPLR